MEESKMKAIKEWIETCHLLEGDKINVDYLKDDINSYSIDRTPSTPVVSTDILGGKVKQITFDFVVQAPLASQAIINLANSKFCEEFMQWVEMQNKKRIYPNIDGMQDVSCTSPGYVLQKTETTAIYIIQMKCEYYEKFKEEK